MVTPFDDDAWEDLLNFLEEKQVIPIVGPTTVSKPSDGRFGAGEVPTASDWGGARQGRSTGRVIRGGEPPDHGGAALARPAQEVGQMIILPPALGAFVLPAEENRPRARSAA